MTSVEPDVRGGSGRPRSAAYICRALAVASGLVGVLGGISIAAGNGGGEPEAGLEFALAGVAASASFWLTSVWLGWAAALYDELRNR
jgi:hypothetical protein